MPGVPVTWIEGLRFDDVEEVEVGGVKLMLRDSQISRAETAVKDSSPLFARWSLA